MDAMLNRAVTIVFAGIAIIIACIGVSCQAAAADKSSAAAIEKQQVGEKKAIRVSAEEFVAAFNKGDSKAIGNLWTADGEYVDENGRIFRGRESIEKEYASFFAQHPNLKLEAAVSSIKPIQP